MFEIPIAGSTNIYMDNETVYKSKSLPESILKKKHLLIAYHRYREADTAGTICVTKEGADTNLSNLLNKILAGPKREYLLDLIRY